MQALQEMIETTLIVLLRVHIPKAFADTEKGIDLALLQMDISDEKTVFRNDILPIVQLPAAEDGSVRTLLYIASQDRSSFYLPDSI
jgi:hypothetical protein